MADKNLMLGAGAAALVALLIKQFAMNRRKGRRPALSLMPDSEFAGLMAPQKTAAPVKTTPVASKPVVPVTTTPTRPRKPG